MRPGFFSALFLLPGTALVFIPAILLWATRTTSLAAVLAHPIQSIFWAGILMLLPGIAMAGWTVRLMLQHSAGTPAPWNPPTSLVVQGPYRHVRNPMISAALAILLGEALLLQSWPIACWLLLFFIANLIYLPLVEEKRMEKRLGEPYLIYKQNVPRWLPRWKPWTG